MMIYEIYLSDPEFESSMRLCMDERGLWYAFRNDGSEYIFDTEKEAAEFYARKYVEGSYNELVKED